MALFICRFIWRSFCNMQVAAAAHLAAVMHGAAAAHLAVTVHGAADMHLATMR